MVDVDIGFQFWNGDGARGGGHFTFNVVNGGREDGSYRGKGRGRGGEGGEEGFMGLQVRGGGRAG